MNLDFGFADENALDVDDVAAALHIARNTVYKLARTGELGSYRVGRKLRFTTRDVEEYIALSHGGGGVHHLAPETSGALASSKPFRSSEGWETSPPSGREADVSDCVLQDGTAGHPFILSGTELAADIVTSCLNEAGIGTARVRTDSHTSLVELYRGRASMATVCLYDRKTNSYNTPYVQRLAPGIPLVVIRLLQRRQGFVVAQGNPKRISTWGGLLKEGVRLANQELGTSARVLLDEKLLMMEANPSLISGYFEEYPTGRSAVQAVSDGDADVGVAAEGIAESVEGVDFLPVQTEWVDLVVRKGEHNRSLVREAKRIASSDAIRGMLAGLGHTSTSQTGAIVYEC